MKSVCKVQVPSDWHSFPALLGYVDVGWRDFCYIRSCPLTSNFVVRVFLVVLHWMKEEDVTSR